jgi:hypothetical protein
MPKRKYYQKYKKESPEKLAGYVLKRKESRRLNPEKVSEQNRKYRISNPLYAKNAQLLRRYGITLDGYNEMFLQQEGCCAVCKKHQSELDKALCVDHDHETGGVRGLLCFNCNAGLGNFKDNSTLLGYAISYLENIK